MLYLYLFMEFSEPQPYGEGTAIGIINPILLMEKLRHSEVIHVAKGMELVSGRIG